ncbi:hypothetical protein V6Z11_1Z061800 [Gossypium hirsutum]
MSNFINPPPLPQQRANKLESESPQQLPMMPSLSQLYKQRSWSPDINRDEAWLRRKGKIEKRRSKSVTDEDLDELKACIELGFGFEFDSTELDQRLSSTFPALGLTTPSVSSPSAASDCDSIPSPVGSPHAIFDPADPPQTVKTRLKQWAQVVACSVRQSSR